MEQIQALFQGDPFARHQGVELTEVGPGRAKARMPLRKEHYNAMGGVHGGAIFALADAVFAPASNSHGTLAVAINVSISYLRPVEGKVLYAEATELSRSRRLGSYTIRVTDEQDRLVAIFQGMVYRRDDPLPAAGGGAPSQG